MIVVDTNVIAYLCLPGSEYAEAAQDLFDEDPDWSVPVLWRSEFRNLLAGYLRRMTLTFETACAIQSAAEDLLNGAEFEVSSDDVLRLVRDSKCSAYDCEFVALALQLDTELVTGDRQILRAYPGVAIPLY